MLLANLQEFHFFHQDKAPLHRVEMAKVLTLLPSGLLPYTFFAAGIDRPALIWSVHSSYVLRLPLQKEGFRSFAIQLQRADILYSTTKSVHVPRSGCSSLETRGDTLY
ncbi:hypothetical protein D3C81_1032050 [compost metagenome]